MKTSASPLLKFSGYTLFAVFWNGILSVFLWDIWKGIQRGAPDWALIMFMIPFGAVGIGAIFGMGYGFLGLFNPRVRLALDREAAELGGQVEVSWNFSGHAERILTLTLSLEGLERATYRRGTKTRTDEAVFIELPLARVTGPDEIRNGRVRCQIPPDLMHTFKARSNEIVWRLKVHGEIHHFPDVNDEFRITVLPGRVAA